MRLTALSWGPQLFDRNSQRPFAPPSAFVAEGLDSDRFLAEMRVAASAPAGLMDLANSRVAGVLRCRHMLWRLPGPTRTHTQPSCRNCHFGHMRCQNGMFAHASLSSQHTAA